MMLAPFAEARIVALTISSRLAAACAYALAVFLRSLGLICSLVSAQAWLCALWMPVRDLRGQDAAGVLLFRSPHR